MTSSFKLYTVTLTTDRLVVMALDVVDAVRRVEKKYPGSVCLSVTQIHDRDVLLLPDGLGQ